MTTAMIVLAVLAAVYVAGVFVGRRARTWKRCVLWTAGGWWFGSLALASPQEALAIALPDARTLTPAIAYQTRYLDLTHLPAEDREAWAGVLSFHLNSLSRERAIVPPRRLAEGKVLAINLADYRIDPFVWFRLENADPYFHVRVDITKDKTTKRTNAQAPWLNKAAADEMTKLTQCSTYLLRGDWFFTQTIVQADRQAGYYDLLGLGKHQKDFDALVGADVVQAEKLRLDVRAMIEKSGVTLNNRAISRVQSLTGAYWFTDDFKSSIDKQNTIRLFEGEFEPPHGDASERYGTLPNGLFAYWLQNDKGVRQDTAPDFIASDAQAPGTDRRVHVGLSCIRCHVEGLRPIDDYARRLYRGTITLRSPDYKNYLVRRRGQYLTDLERELTRDRAVFAAAVRDCNGLTVAANAKAVAGAWAWYVERAVPLSEAAAELGCDEAELLLKLKLYATTDGLIDPVIAGYLNKPPQAVRREHFEEVYPSLQKIAGGVP